jgi:hypothetical protein
LEEPPKKLSERPRSLGRSNNLTHIASNKFVSWAVKEQMIIGFILIGEQIERIFR